jgi:hypothetical protein
MLARFIATAAISAAVVFALGTPARAACILSLDAPRVAYIGDSHSTGEFGKRLATGLTTEFGSSGLAIKRFAVAGSAANHWNRTDNAFLRRLKIQSYCDGDGTITNAAPSPTYPIFRQTVAGRAPAGVVIALGTNDIGWYCGSNDPAAQTRDALALLQQIPVGVPCAWIGPTNFTRGTLVNQCGRARIDTFLNNLSSAVSRRCTYIDSRRFTLPGPNGSRECMRSGASPLAQNSGDGIHYGGDVARYWAECAGREAVAALRGR